jgi:hypothetical protein
MVILLGVFATICFVYSVIHHLRAEWYRDQLEVQAQAFAALLRSVQAEQASAPVESVPHSSAA